MATSSPFSGFDVRIDPWAVEYGSETPLEFAADDESAADLDLSVEVDAARWAAIRPRTDLPRVEMAIVDGVRRMEARLVVSTEGRTLHGALGAYGVGVVHCRDGRATFGREDLGRLLIFGSGHVPPAPVAVSPGLVYDPLSVAEDDPDAPLRGLHREMRSAEERLARELARDERVLVIADGPLSIGDNTPGRVVGFVKRLFKLYLPPEHLPVLRALPFGTRTPVFLIRSAGRFARYSWFIRIGTRLAMESDMTGLVRLELAEGMGVDEARRLADLTAAVIPAFVPSRSRDPRAPQNLVPIGALEQHLRRGLGDARLIHRRLATLLARELAHV
ncbi:MAG: hypothetical protein AB7H96_23205 [Vicinamibacterales bacterium]